MLSQRLNFPLHIIIERKRNYKQIKKKNKCLQFLLFPTRNKNKRELNIAVIVNANSLGKNKQTNK